MSMQPTGPYYSTQPGEGAMSTLNSAWGWLVGAATDAAIINSQFADAEATRKLAEAQLAQARKPAPAPIIAGANNDGMIPKELGYALLGLSAVMVFAGVFLMVRK